jgi:hypothetical protein
LKRSVIVALTALVGSAGCSASLPVQLPENVNVLPGCGAASAPVADDSFTPVEQMLTQPREVSIMFFKVRLGSIEEAVIPFDPLLPRTAPAAGPLQATLTESDPAVRESERSIMLVYSPNPLADNDTFASLMAGGGLTISQRAQLPLEGPDRAAQVINEVGKRGAFVAVGPHRAAWIHGDPVLRNEIRPFALYWNDGVRDWVIQSGRKDPAEVINVARSIYC